MAKVRIGIDIGSKGAIAIFKNDILIELSAFPLLETRPDIEAFSVKLLSLIESDDKVHAVIEDLHSIFGVGASANFSFGWINGAVESTLIILNIPYTKVGAKKWQRALWEGIRPIQIPVKGKVDKEGNQKYKTDTKATSLLAAKRLFPDQSFLATPRSKVPHDGQVDALLIAEYCRRNF